MIKGKYHVYHLITNNFSILMYLLLSSVNTLAAKWGLSFFFIGLMNFTGALSYIATSFALGRLGDKYGHKKVISYALLVFAIFSALGFLLSNTVELFIFVVGINVFFGTFFPQIEGLLSKQEKSLGIDTANTIQRFNLSWSTGNIVGIILGPFLISKVPYVVFAFSIFLNLVAYFIIKKDMSKHGESVNFIPSMKIKHTSNVRIPDIKLYRRVYRLTLVFSGLTYAAFLSLFPKMAAFSGIPISISGFLAAGANLGVLISFIVLGKIRIWVGEPLKAFVLMMGFPVEVILLFVHPSIGQFFFLAFFAGVSYAVPYTYAIFYALNSYGNEHSKQGGFHEATIGTLSAFGPLLGGLSIQTAHGMIGLGIMALLLLSLVVIVQIRFIRHFVVQI